MGNMLSQAAGVLAFLFNGKPAMCRLGLFVSTGDTIQTLSRWEHWRRTRQIADIPISSDPCWSLLDLVLKIWTASDTTWVEIVELRLPMLCNSSVIDYLNMRDEGGLVKGLVKVEIASLGQDKR